jgi:acetolactate synthase-1/2/3 large subunit
MTLQELLAIAHDKLPIKVIIFNNHGYLTIRHTQNSLFNGALAASSPESGVTCPDFKKIAEAYGIQYIYYDSAKSLPESPPPWLTTLTPYLCEIKMPYMQPLVPKTAFKTLPDGTLVSPPLEDLYPFLPREEFQANMLIPTINV